ncbi:MAG: hypothetical protein WBIAU1_04140 [Wolbachia endosymbiont of Drosophila biauraria]|nr:MAG: hypothetical protein WBIAU1_04140 [Wolbachia endosymbiont of Drosophila biauraria]
MGTTDDAMSGCLTFFLLPSRVSGIVALLDIVLIAVINAGIILPILAIQLVILNEFAAPYKRKT